MVKNSWGAGDERVQLQRPGVPPDDDPTFIPRLSEDEVLYDSDAPWPDTSGGNTLERQGANFYGNAVASWEAATPTPGSVNFTGGLTGDFNGDNVVDATDIDLLYVAVNGNGGGEFDLELMPFGSDGGEVDGRDAVFDIAVDPRGASRTGHEPQQAETVGGVWDAEVYRRGVQPYLRNDVSGRDSCARRLGIETVEFSGLAHRKSVAAGFCVNKNDGVPDIGGAGASGFEIGCPLGCGESAPRRRACFRRRIVGDV